MIPRVFILFITVFSILWSTTSSAETQNKIPIGLSTVLSGPWSSYGTSLKNGVNLAQEQVKNSFEIDIQDDRCESKTALSNAQKFLQAGTKIIMLGCMETLEAVAPVAARKDALVVSLGFISDDILALHNNIIGLSTFADAETRSLGPYIHSLKTIDSVVVINGTNNVGEALGSRLVSDLKKLGIKVKLHLSIPVETTDFRSLIAKALKESPSAIYVHQSEATLLSFVRQVREAGYKGRLFTSFIENDSTKRAMGDYLEGIEYSYPLSSARKNLKWEEFNVAYTNKFAESPNPYAGIAYDAAVLIDSAVSRCGSVKKDCVLKFFTDLKYDGVAGHLEMTKLRGALRPMGIKRIEEKQFVWVVKDNKLM